MVSRVFSIVATEMSAPEYSDMDGRLRKAVRDEMTAWGISGIALALVDGQRAVYVGAFGDAELDSVFRCGSISKLFTAVAVMQLVESNKLDLDASLAQRWPFLLPVNPYADTPAVTLRQLLCHRSGVIREAPVGGYLDASQPGLARTIASVTGTVLVNPPNSKTRYSNVGPSIAGRIVELVAGVSFGRYQRDHILGPLGMTSSWWAVKGVPGGRLIAAHMRVADGKGGFKRKAAPVFDLGTVPAGNLFTTAADLARFVGMLAAGGMGPGRRVLQNESILQMLTPQLTTEPGCYGLGFALGECRGHKLVSHNGAVYGHSCSLAFLPGPKLGVALLANEDIVTARVQKLANRALDLMLEAKLGRSSPAAPRPIEVSRSDLEACAGEYESQSYWASLSVHQGRLIGDISGQPTSFTPLEPLRFVADSRINDATPVLFQRGPQTGPVSGFKMGIQEFKRVSEVKVEPPRAWRPFLGSYGPVFIPLVISARYGHLYAMTENMVDYRLTPINRFCFRFPPGLYADEQLVFHVDSRGRAKSVDMANMVLLRR